MKELKVKIGEQEVEGKLGFEVTTLYSEEVSKRYEWCYLMERIYLFKHIEILQITINICYLMNSLFIIYYFFSKIVKLRDITGKSCPIPEKVVLPPSYQKLIEVYFQTQRKDLKQMNKQIEGVVKEINTVLNASQSKDDKGEIITPPAFKKMGIKTDFKNKPMGYTEYSKLLSSNAINKKVFYVKKLDNKISALKENNKNVIIDVRKIEEDTYYIDEFSKAKEIKKNDGYYEVLVVRTIGDSDETVKNLRNSLKEIDTELIESFISGKDNEIVDVDTKGIVNQNKMQFTGAVLVNLNSPPTEKYEEKYQELVDKLKTELDLKQNFRVVYVNVYQNQLKVMFTLSKDKQADLQTIKEKISSRSVNIFEGVFKPVDGTKVILTNWELN